MYKFINKGIDVEITNSDGAVNTAPVFIDTDGLPYFYDSNKDEFISTKEVEVFELKQELEDLKLSLKDGFITTNEYQDFYHNIYQKINRLES